MFLKQLEIESIAVCCDIKNICLGLGKERTRKQQKIREYVLIWVELWNIYITVYSKNNVILKKKILSMRSMKIQSHPERAFLQSLVGDHKA